MIAVVTGFDRAKNRDLFARKLLDWGYARMADPAAANARTAQYKPVPKKAVRKAAPRKKKPVSKKR